MNIDQPKPQWRLSPSVYLDKVKLSSERSSSGGDASTDWVMKRALSSTYRAWLIVDARLQGELKVAFWRVLSSQPKDPSSLCVTDEIGLSYTYEGSAPERRVALKIVRDILSEAGWARYRRRAGEQWVKLPSARALTLRSTPPHSSLLRGPRASLSRPQRSSGALDKGQALLVLNHHDTDEALKSSSSTLLTQALRLSQLNERRAARGDIKILAPDLTHRAILFERVDHQVMTWATASPDVELVAWSVSPKIERSPHGATPSNERTLWDHLSPPTEWPHLSHSVSPESANTPDDERRDTRLDPQLQPICREKPLLNLPLMIRSSAPLGELNQSHEDSAEAFIFRGERSPELMSALGDLPEHLARSIGVSVLSLSSKGEAHLQRERLLLIRLTGRAHMDPEERSQLISAFSSLRSMASLYRVSSQPLIYLECNASLSPPLSHDEIARIVGRLADLRSMKSGVTSPRSLTLLLTMFSASKGLEMPIQAESAHLTPITALEISPWLEHRGRELLIALSSRCQDSLTRWLNSASITLSPAAFN